MIICDNLSKEDDQDPEVWYLYGFCYYRIGGGGEDQENFAVEIEVKNDSWDDARDCFMRVLGLCEESPGSVDQELYEHTVSMNTEVDTYLRSIGWEYDDPNDGGGWQEIVDDDEDEMQD